ncbi:MAG: hypothetical protein IIY21_18760, partial [Clostridiales bacterium]|nr:hypothetical protein [Clostridiales bacterium]
MITTNSSGNPISQSFINAITDSITPYMVKLFISGVEVVCDIVSMEITKGSVGDVTAFNVGAVIGSELSAELKNLSVSVKGEEIEARIGLGSEYITLGYFTVTEAPKTIYSTNIKAYGACVSKTGGDFTSPQDMTPPQALTIANIIDEIEVESGVTVSVDSGIDTTAEFVYPMSGITTYQALQGVVAAVGGYAMDTNDGNIAIKLFDATPTSAVSSEVMKDLPQAEESDFEVTGVLVNTPAGGIGSQTTINLVTESTYLTSDMFSDYESAIVGYAYRTAEMDMTMGDPRLEGDDVLTVTDVMGNTYTVPCHQVTHSWKGGGVSSKVRSAKATELEKGIATPPPISGQIADVKETAENAEQMAEESRNYFWFTSEDTGFGMGAHITQKTQAEVLADPTNAGGNVLIDSNSLDIRDGEKVLATFSADGVNIGEESATSRAKFSADGFEVEDDTLLTVVKIGKGETLSNHYLDEHNGRVHWYDNYFLMRSWNNGIKMESPIGEIKFSIPWAKYDQSNTLADSGTLTFQFDEGVEETQYDSTNSVRVYYSGTDYITYHIDGDAYRSYMRDYCGEGNLYSTTERQLWSVNQDYVNYNGYSGMFVHIEGGFRNSTRTFSMNFAIPEGLLPSAGHKEMVAQTAVGEYTIKGYVQAVGTTSYKITFKAWGNEWGYPYVKDTSYMMIRPHNVLFPNGMMKVDYYGTSEAPYYSFGQRSEGLYGAYSFTMGQELIAEHPRALVTGKFNDDAEDYAFQIGNGVDDLNRSNAFTVDWDGDVTIAGKHQALYKITTLAVETGSISADSYKSAENYPMTEVDGYNAVGIVGWTTTNWRIQPTSHYVASNTQLYSGFANYKAPPASG